VQHYARHDLMCEDVSGWVPVSEDAIAQCIAALESFRRSAQRDLQGYQTALADADRRVVAAENRTRRAEVRADLVTDAYTDLLEGQAPGGKRPRGS
jgi:hypothetical protein